MDDICRETILNRIQNYPTQQNNKYHNPHLIIACIMDRFSFDCFKYECSLKYLPCTSWKAALDNIHPDFLLVESVWEGVDQSWRGQLANLESKTESEIEKLVAYCQAKKIVTVFWNKEDPPNYQIFIGVAKLFDYVFTTDQNSIKRYYKDLNHQRVFSLPFAAQPAIHNPMNSHYSKKENVAFAGTWYNKYLKRQVELKMILNPSVSYGVHIFDRMFKTPIMDYKFPVEFEENIIGNLTYNDMINAYKMYKIFLNVNTVKKSPTMFSRRVFEILASGTNVISTYSQGISRYFKQIVPLVVTEEDTEKALSFILNNREFSERLSLLGVREVYQKHLFKHRLGYILEKLNMADKIEDDNGVSVVSYVTGKTGFQRVLENFYRQKYMKKELVIFSDTIILEEDLPKSPDINFVKYQQGEILNLIRSACKFPFISVFGEGHYYAPYFLTDLMHGFYFTEADIVGKTTFYQYFRKNKELYLVNPERENTFTDSVRWNGAIFRKDILEHFSYLIDNVIRGEAEWVNDTNLKIYASDRFSYVALREERNEEKDLANFRLLSVTKDYKTHAHVEKGVLFQEISKEKLALFDRNYLNYLFNEKYPGLQEVIREKITPKHSILIYGAGEHTERLLRKIKNLVLNIIGLVDKDPQKQGKSLYGFPVYPLEKINTLKPEIVIISSMAHELVILEDLKQLCDDGIELYPLYNANKRFARDIYFELYLFQFPLNPDVRVVEKDY